LFGGCFQVTNKPLKRVQTACGGARKKV
jgi:hypothetical protein